MIINNGSTDNTENVIREFSDRLPIFHFYEPAAGLSNARNRAVHEVHGEYLIWTDDDVLVEPDWLSAYVSAFKTYKDAVVFGGKILPKLTPPTPKWFSDTLHILKFLVAYRDFGDMYIPLSSEVIPFGANYAVRMLEQMEIKYNPNLGASPNHRRVGEETTVITSLLANGGKGIWVPNSIVYHCIPTTRQTVSYVFQYYKSLGETAAFSKQNYECPKWFYIPRWLLLRLTKRFVQYHSDRLTKSPEVWVKSLINYANDRGMVDHWRNFPLV